MRKTTIGLGLALVALAAPAFADGLKEGKPDLKSAGPIAFGPDGLLFVADTQGACVYAIDTKDQKSATRGTFTVEGIDRQVAAMLGTDAKNVAINDIAVNPVSGKVYLAASRGRGPDALPVLLRVDQAGKVEEVSLDKVPYARAALPNPPASGTSRAESITDLAYADGRLIVAGLSNEEFSSRLIVMPYPFNDSADGTKVEIYHGAHGRFETKAPVRTFMTYKIGGQPYVVAAYTCTPLVKFPMSALKPGAEIKGVTVAELGNRNKPLDMIAYTKGGKDFILLANSNRGVMKIDTAGIETNETISKKIDDKAGLKYETIEPWAGVLHLDKLDDTHAVVLIQAQDGAMTLKSVDLP
ncbi:MAG: hypothetical protein U0800_03870 [Isosphaeraceae bacterium]